MQQHRQPGLEVVIQSNGTGSHASQRLPRPLSVDEALQYSPMTSAPVFGLDSVMRPDVGRTSLAGWSRPYDSQVAGRIIDSLDNETQASSGSSESTRLETAREYLQQLLRQDDLTELFYGCYIFLYVIIILSYSLRLTFPSLDSTPVTPNPVKQRQSSKAFPTPLSSSKAQYASKIEVQVRQPSVAASHSSEKLPKPMVIIPSLSPATKIDDFKYISDLGSVKRRKVDSQNEEKQDSLPLRDQKQMSDAALVKLQALLHEILEAEEQLLPDAPLESQASGKFFKLPSTIGDIGSRFVVRGTFVTFKSLAKGVGLSATWRYSDRLHKTYPKALRNSYYVSPVCRFQIRKSSI
ncbi:conserved hypothetical protein [Uncinocarpus reesii 1704]|uniref:Uncharacterized protein n=1 Tax=Uncinocarpus reesii (strain UAMH 1704) TaxID=336963 RepID=C4JDL9_UNCRE|nr:uncharacterized protein UREG_00728 [Uncinocarpus reesii 1704]EEP75881.1 conserved hypothetical protein [Uncinocarpus reesii 1704]